MSLYLLLYLIEFLIYQLQMFHYLDKYFQIVRLWPKPLTEMTVVKLSYQLKLTNHTIMYISC